MIRREFITLLGGAAAAWPLAARAQQGERMRRIGVLLPAAADDAEFQARVGAFLQGLQRIGLDHRCRNVRIDMRWAAANADRIRRHAAELVALAPDVILAHGASAVGPCSKRPAPCRSCSWSSGDPVGAGFVDSLARPGGNATGFMHFEYGMGGKWLELLKEIAPGVTRVAVLRDPPHPRVGQFGVIQTAAPTLGVEVNPINIRDARRDRARCRGLCSSPNGGLILTGSGLANVHRDLIVTLAARHKLPAVYFERYFVAAGGLMSYGPDILDQYRRAAAYVDRILKGEKPADLPVQAPTKYELAINLKTAKALGLEIPPSLARPRRRGDRMKRRAVHHAARRRGGGVAARGARAAARADAAHRRAHEPGRGRSRSASPRRSVPAGAAGIRLGRRPQHADRISLGGGRCRPNP